MGCKALVVCALALPEATSANSFCWPSSNSDEKLWVIDDAELMVSWGLEKKSKYSSHFLDGSWMDSNQYPSTFCSLLFDI
jgi:hypothetical protein